jgi:hypothetical protein
MKIRAIEVILSLFRLCNHVLKGTFTSTTHPFLNRSTCSVLYCIVIGAVFNLLGCLRCNPPSPPSYPRCIDAGGQT